MPHLLITGKLHPAGLALLEGRDGFTYDYVEEVSEPSYSPLIGKADALVIRTQPLSSTTIARAVSSVQNVLGFLAGRLDSDLIVNKDF